MSQYTKEEIVKSVPQKGFFGHPSGLKTLFFTEFWERFSYYGMRAILVYYMYAAVSDGGLGLDRDVAIAIMSIYGSLVYMSGIIGGWFADRVFGTSKAVFYGGIFIMFGHIALAIPGNVAFFFTSMTLIVIGTGLLKPNVSNMVGDIYPEKDLRRDSGFSIFYMGINLGSFLAPIIVGTVGMNYNYHLGFGLAAIGMFAGLVMFVLSRKKHLGLAGLQVPNPLAPETKNKVLGSLALGTIILAIVAYGLGQIGILTIQSFILFVGILGILIPTLYFVVMFRSPKTTPREKTHLTAYIPLFIASVIFWVIAEQGSTILAIYAKERTNLTVLGYTFSPTIFQSFNPLFIITLAPLFAWLWVKLGDRQPSIPRKFSFGLLFAGLSFIVILIPGLLGGTDTLVSPFWLILSIFLVVLGELSLSPVGLSATTKLAPAAFSAQTMSLWFLSNAAAQAINAQIAKFYSEQHEAFYFGTIAAIAIIFGIILYLVAPRIQKYIDA